MLAEGSKGSKTPYKVSDSIADNQLLDKKLASAFTYAFMSILTTFTNKIVLKLYRFHSYQVLGLGQMLASIIILKCVSNFKIITFPPLGREVFRIIYPLPIFYIGSVFIGIFETGCLNIPTVTALRRISIVLTMYAERYVIGIKCSWLVELSVFVLVLGGLITAADDITFSLSNYILVLFNDICTAAWAVSVKKRLVAQDLGMHGLMYYNSIFMFVPSVILAWMSGDLRDSVLYTQWDDVFFVIHFFLSCIMGFMLTYSVFLCTQYNSALTTAVIACLKNTLFTHADLYFGTDDYHTGRTVIGIHISIIASLLCMFLNIFVDKP